MATKQAAKFTRHHGARGSKYEMELIPMDYAILAELPPEGSMLGFHILGAPVSGVVTKLRDVDPAVTSTQVSGRIGSMHKLGLVADVTIVPVARGRGWQITPEGQKVLDAWNASK